jgi:glycosyltransferase involved in cell wall biosynthesis
MKVLLCHTYYMQRGGEDRSFEEERDLLRANGHDVLEYVRSNDELADASLLRAAGQTVWNRQAAREVRTLLRSHRPDVMHCTNTFPLISPSVCYEARRAQVALVQSLRNYRLLCANSYLMRDGRPCEDCIGARVPWPAVLHRCYRDSTAASAAVASMQIVHRALGAWRNCVNAFFTLTEFARQKFIDAGFPEYRVHVKNNAVSPDPGLGSGEGRYAVFVGRLSAEKGLSTLLQAWRSDPILPRLKIVGDGPLAAQVEAAATGDRRIDWLGRLGTANVHGVIGDASMLIMPSLWYETFGRTIAEAYAAGTPVVASRLGAMAELVDEPSTGRLFEAGNPKELAAKVRQVAALPAAEAAALRSRCRSRFEERFTAKRNFQRLLEIYGMAMEHASGRIGRHAVHVSHEQPLLGGVG